MIKKWRRIEAYIVNDGKIREKIAGGFWGMIGRFGEI